MYSLQFIFHKESLRQRDECLLFWYMHNKRTLYELVASEEDTVCTSALFVLKINKRCVCSWNIYTCTRTLICYLKTLLTSLVAGNKNNLLSCFLCSFNKFSAYTVEYSWYMMWKRLTDRSENRETVDKARPECPNLSVWFTCDARLEIFNQLLFELLQSLIDDQIQMSSWYFLSVRIVP